MKPSTRFHSAEYAQAMDEYFQRLKGRYQSSESLKDQMQESPALRTLFGDETGARFDQLFKGMLERD